MNKFFTMLKTELRLSFRGMDMVIFALCMPVVVTIIWGVIYGAEAAAPEVKYTFLEQSFGALSAIAICAGSVMGLPLLISDYRQKKILKRYKVTPASPAFLLAVWVTIYAVYSLLSLGLVFGVLSIFFGCRFGGSAGIFLLMYLLVMCSMFSIGLMVGGLRLTRKQPVWLPASCIFRCSFFRGATLPYEVMPSALQKIADVLPLTQGIKLLKAVSLGLPLESVRLPIAVMAAVAVVCGGFAVRFFKWE